MNESKAANTMNSARQMTSPPKEPNSNHQEDSSVIVSLAQYEQLQEENTNLTIQLTELKKKFNAQREQLNSFTGYNNTASNQLLPSEFKEEWDSFYRNTISDFFIDFFEYPYMTFHLVQELFFISKKLIDIIIQDYPNKMLSAMKLDSTEGNRKYITSIIEKIIKDNYEELFDSKRAESRFYDRFVAKYRKFYAMMFNGIKEKEFNDILSFDNSKSLKLLLKKIRSILIFIHLNSDAIFFEVDDSANREFIIKDVEEASVYVIQKDYSNKSKMLHCGLIINPPQLKKKKGFYHNLKPIVFNLNEDYSKEKDKEMFKPKESKLKPITNINLQGKTCFTQESEEGLLKKYNYSPRDYPRIGRATGNVTSLSKQKVYQAIKVFDNKVKKQIPLKSDSKYNEFIIRTNNNMTKKPSSINNSLNTNEANQNKGVINNRQLSKGLVKKDNQPIAITNSNM